MTSQHAFPPGIGEHGGNGAVSRSLATRPADPPVGSDLGGLSGDPPRRRWLTTAEWSRLALLALALVVLGAASGYFAATLMPERYAAHADLLYTVTREQPTGFLREDRNISTQLVLLQSRTVLAPVAEEWRVPIDELSAAVTASVIEESEVISVQLVDSDPDRAREMLGAVIARYLEVSPNDARAGLRNYLDAQLAEVIARIDAIPPGMDDRQGVLAPLVDREQWLRTRLDELQFTDIAGPEARVLVQPFVESDPVSPRPVITTAAGATAGLVVALLGVAFLARRMTRPDVPRP